MFKDLVVAIGDMTSDVIDRWSAGKYYQTESESRRHLETLNREIMEENDELQSENDYLSVKLERIKNHTHLYPSEISALSSILCTLGHGTDEEKVLHELLARIDAPLQSAIEPDEWEDTPTLDFICPTPDEFEKLRQFLSNELDD